MTDRLAALQAFYTRWTRLYDLVASAPGIAAWRERVAESLSLSPGDTVVEMGCGTGANFPHLRERIGPAGTLVGLDIAPGMVEHARRRVAGAGWDNVHVMRADAIDPPIAGPIDAVLATFVVGLFPTPEIAVRGWLDCLVPGGRLALLNAGRSEWLVAAPLNLAFRVFVRLAAVGTRASSDSPTARLETRFEDARATLAAGSEIRVDERFAGGFLRLTVGQR